MGALGPALIFICLLILAGLLARTSGEALLNGTPIDGPRKDIGVVFQSPVLFMPHSGSITILVGVTSCRPLKLPSPVRMLAGFGAQVPVIVPLVGVTLWKTT